MGYSDSFKKALQFTLSHEGKLSNDPADPGGFTNQGITQATYNMWRHSEMLPPQSVEYMEDSERDAIYNRWYWVAIGGDQLPQALAIAAFDWAVNSGPFRINQRLADLKNDPSAVQKLMNQRREFYRDISGGKNQKFLRGWLNRCDDLEKFLGVK